MDKEEIDRREKHVNALKKQKQINLKKFNIKFRNANFKNKMLF